MTARSESGVVTARSEAARPIETPQLAIAYAPPAPPPRHARGVHPAYPVR
jgi:hypothetical protein